MRLDLDGFTEIEVLGYVLAGLMSRHAAIAAKIEEIRTQLDGVRATASAAPAKRGRKPAAVAVKTTAVKSAAPAKRGRPAKAKVMTGKRTLSPEARQRIADAQHRRWATAKKKTRTRGQKVKLAEPEAITGSIEATVDSAMEMGG